MIASNIWKHAPWEKNVLVQKALSKKYYQKWQKTEKPSRSYKTFEK